MVKNNIDSIKGELLELQEDKDIARRLKDQHIARRFAELTDFIEG